VSFLRRRGSIERAEDLLTELAGRWPNNIAVLSTLSDVRLGRRNWIGAEEVAERIRRIGDDRGLADLIAGAALSGGGRYEDSIRAAEKAYAAGAGDPQRMAALVSALVRANKFDRAMALLQNILQENSDNADALVLLGSIQLQKGEQDKAVQSFQTAVERQPGNMVGYRALADFYLRQKNNGEAIRVIRAGLREQPESFSMRLMLAGVLGLKGDYDAAIAEYDDILMREPGSMVVANNLASLLAEHRTDKASLDRAFSVATILRKSQAPQFKDTLGWVYYCQGDYKTASSLLEEAAAELPNVPEVRYHLGMTYIATGQPVKAVEQLKKALELAADNRDLQSKIKVAQEKAAI
jgi:cellulose synthase operon protein C